MTQNHFGLNCVFCHKQQDAIRINQVDLYSVGSPLAATVDIGDLHRLHYFYLQFNGRPVHFGTNSTSLGSIEPCCSMVSPYTFEGETSHYVDSWGRWTLEMERLQCGRG